MFHLILVLAMSLVSCLVQANDQELVIKRVLKLEIDSSINPATYNYVHSGFEKARSEGHDLVLITLNTPGGLVSTTKQILTEIGSAAIPTVIWVAPEGASATSAGAIIAASAHVLLLAPGCNIGAATPIGMGKDIGEGDARNKAVNDLVALIQSLAESRGRNSELFTKMIKDAASYGTQEASKSRLIDGIANSQKEVLQLLHGRRVTLHGKVLQLSVDEPAVDTFAMDLGQRLLDIFANPNLAYILFLIGAALLYFELQAPGGFIAGSIGAFCLILAGIGFQVLPLNFGSLGLILLAFFLFFLEIYVTSYGVLLLSGMVSLVVGSLFLFRTDNAYLEVSKGLIVAACAGVGLFIAFIFYFWVHDARRQKKKRAQYDFKGRKGTIIAVLSAHQDGPYEYQVRIEGEIWQAQSSTLFQIGDTCEIKEDKGAGMVLVI